MQGNESKISPKKTGNPKLTEKNQNNVSIWLDNYDDIFSDFDPRNLNERNISDDFLDELKKLVSETSFQIQEIKLLLPSDKRNDESERIISSRLHAFFKKNITEQKNERTKTKKNGIGILITGLILLLIAGYISKFQTANILIRVLFVITEPSGWYFAWSGFEKIFSISENKRITFSFYQKLARSKIQFYKY